MAKGQYQIPFDASGNLMEAVYGWSNHNQVTWKDNYKFTDELEYVGYSQGRSSCHIELKSTTDNRQYHMTIGDFHECVIKRRFVDNKIKEEFTFAKRGTHYMLTFVKL